MRKIKIRTILAAILAVIIGILVYIYLGSLRQEVNIYIATTDITKGTILNEMVLKETAVSKNDSMEIAAGAMKPVGEGETAIAVCDIKVGNRFLRRKAKPLESLPMELKRSPKKKLMGLWERLEKTARQ